MWGKWRNTVNTVKKFPKTFRKISHSIFNNQNISLPQNGKLIGKCTECDMPYADQTMIFLSIRAGVYCTVTVNTNRYVIDFFLNFFSDNLSLSTHKIKNLVPGKQRSFLLEEVSTSIRFSRSLLWNIFRF